MKKDNKHKSNSGFKTPNNYFENFGKKLMGQLERDDQKKNTLNSDITSGFKTPDNYFENFEKRLMDTLQIENHEENIAENKIESGFKVPEGYFNSLEENLTQKLKTEDTPEKGKIVSLFSRRNILYVSGIAAMIAIIISISINKDNDLLKGNGIEDIELAVIQDYFAEGNIELSNEDMASLIDEETSYSDFFEEKPISDEELLEYLSDTDLANEIMFTD